MCCRSPKPKPPTRCSQANRTSAGRSFWALMGLYEGHKECERDGVRRPRLTLLNTRLWVSASTSSRGEGTVRIATVLVLSLSLAGGTVMAQGPKITSLLSRDLAGTPGKELSMITVDYPPG